MPQTHQWSVSFLAAVTLVAVVSPQVLAQPPVLNYKQIPQFVNGLPNPLDPAFIWQPDTPGGNAYTLRIQEIRQSLGLGRGVPDTTVWGYGKTGQAASFPGRTFELDQGSPITVTY